MQVRAGPFGREHCSKGNAECWAYSRCSINACSRKVGDDVLGTKERGSGIGGGEKAGQGGQECGSHPSNQGHRFSATPKDMPLGFLRCGQL